MMCIFVGVLASSVGAQVEPPTRSHYEMSPEEFRLLPEVQREMRIGAIDPRLVQVAIFHETNARRAQAKLLPLKHVAEVDQAAQIHATAMVKQGFFEHENPTEQEIATPAKRVEKVGLKYRFVAENIATNFAVEYDSNRPVYEGRRGWSYERNGAPLPNRTYVGFANAVVEAWMKSPGHRANILSREPTVLGTAIEIRPRDAESEPFDSIYCVQVFFDPQSRGLETMPRAGQEPRKTPPRPKRP